MVTQVTLVYLAKHCDFIRRRKVSLQCQDICRHLILPRLLFFHFVIISKLFILPFYLSISGLPYQSISAYHLNFIQKHLKIPFILIGQNIMYKILQSMRIGRNSHAHTFNFQTSKKKKNPKLEMFNNINAWINNIINI